MAGTSLLTLLDDIATLLDDVAILSKTALKKTSGVLGDDLALNAEQVSGVKADRELPVVWAVAKGSFINKLILVPAALLISAFIPWLITPLLMIGGAYLCYEGAEKVLHRLLHKEHHDKHKEELKRAFEDPEVDLAAYEANKIKGAIRTDFILSAEIIVIALGTVQTAPFAKQSLVVATIAFAITVFVYGLVAGIVKLDDAGLHLIKLQGDALFSRLKRRVGSLLLWFAPNLMRTLTFVGTLAMFLVGGGIIIHGFHFLTDWQDFLLSWLAEHTIAMAYLGWLWSALYTVVTGFVIGALLIPIFSLTSRFVLSQENKTD